MKLKKAECYSCKVAYVTNDGVTLTTEILLVMPGKPNLNAVATLLTEKGFTFSKTDIDHLDGDSADYFMVVANSTK